MHARAWPHLHDVIGGANRVLVVLDDDHRVADVAKTLERRDHLDVVFRVQADARLVEDVEHAHQPRPDLRGQPDALRLAARQRAGAAVEAEIVEPDSQQQIQAAADLLQDMAPGVGAAAGRLDGAEKRLQLVEVQLPDVVDGLAFDGEQQAAGPQPRPRAVGARVLDHHLVEPLLHSGVGFSALAIAAVVALDAARDAVEADFLALVVVPPYSRFGRRRQHDLLRIDAVEHRLPHLLLQIFPWRVEREVEPLRQAEHHAAVPRVRVVLEGLLDEATAADAALRIGDEQIGMRELVHAQPAAGSTGALGIVEDEVGRADLSVDEVMRRAADAPVEPVGVCLARTGEHVDLHQPVAHQQRRRHAGLNRFFVLPVHDKAIDDGVHVLHGRFVELELRGDVHRLPVHDDPPAALLAKLGEDEVQILAVDLEHRRAQLDLGPGRQRQNRFENLARRSARRRLSGARTVRLADGGEQQIQIARHVGHRPDRGARVAGQRLLLDRDHRRQTEHEVHVRLGHLGNESLRVARERFHVPALAFGVDRVEGQAGLAGSGQPGHHDETVARDLERDVLEVVDARAFHRDRRPCGLGRSRVRSPARRGGSPAHRRGGSSDPPVMKKASSCTSALLFLVRRAAIEALPIRP